MLLRNDGDFNSYFSLCTWIFLFESLGKQLMEQLSQIIMIQSIEIII